MGSIGIVADVLLRTLEGASKNQLEKSGVRRTRATGRRQPELVDEAL